MRRSLLSILRMLGFERLYAWTCVMYNDPGLREGMRVSPKRRKELMSSARYYIVGNVGRALINLWAFYVLWKIQAFIPLVPMALLLLTHVICVFNEFYKLTMVPYLVVDDSLEEDEEVPIPPFVAPTGWFELKAWESSELYKRLGVDWFRRTVVDYIEGLQGKTKFLDMTNEGLTKFERETRANEMVHAVVGLLNLPGVIKLITSMKFIPASLILVFVSLDFGLVALQRFHRTRVIRILEKRGVETRAYPA